MRLLCNNDADADAVADDDEQAMFDNNNIQIYQK